MATATTARIAMAATPREPDARPRLVERELPVEPDHVAAARCGVFEVRAHAEREVDDGDACCRDLREELAVRRGDVP